VRKYGFLLIIGLLMSCTADDATTEVSTVELFVDHYQTTNALSGLTYVVQEGQQIGTDQFSSLNNIDGFNFEPGFISRIIATKTVVQNAGTEGRTATYELNQLVSKEPVAPGTRFMIPISTVTPGGETLIFLQKRPDGNFYLSGEILIECRSFCGNLNAVIDEQLLADGIFSHGPDGRYILENLLD
jgi:hypothetical protein